MVWSDVRQHQTRFFLLLSTASYDDFKIKKTVSCLLLLFSRLADKVRVRESCQSLPSKSSKQSFSGEKWRKCEKNNNNSRKKYFQASAAVEIQKQKLKNCKVCFQV